MPSADRASSYWRGKPTSNEPLLFHRGDQFAVGDETGGRVVHVPPGYAGREVRIIGAEVTAQTECQHCASTHHTCSGASCREGLLFVATLITLHLPECQETPD